MPRPTGPNAPFVWTDDLAADDLSGLAFSLLSPVVTCHDTAMGLRRILDLVPTQIRPVAHQPDKPPIGSRELLVLPFN